MEGIVNVGSVPGLPVHNGHNEATIALKVVDVLHLLLSQTEVEDLSVLLNPGRSDRLGDDDDAPLDLPAEDDLGRALAVLAGDVFQLGVVQQADVAWLGPGPVRRAERRVGCDGDPSLPAEVQEFGLAEVGVALNLVGDGLDAAPGQDVLDLFGVEIRDS